MEPMTCPHCGANEIQINGNHLICPYCNSRFLPGSLQHKKGSLGYAPQDLSSGIALSDDVNRLLQKCRTEPNNARRYANLILDIDPNNKEALQYL